MSIAVKTADGWQVLGVGSGGGNLVGGVAGWAAIESVSGTADLATLQAAGIAPATATADNECPGTYNITDDGVVYRVAVFTTSGGNVKTSDGLLDCLLVGGAAANQNTMTGNAGDVRSGLRSFSNSTHTVTVGDGGSRTPGIGNSGKRTSVGPHRTSSVGLAEANAPWQAYGADGDGAVGGTTDDVNRGLLSNITGSPVTYAQANTTPTANTGNSANSDNTDGASGIVVVRAPKDAEQPWEPAPELPGVGGWATITGIDGTAGTRYQYGDWVAYEWTADGSLTTQAGGLADVLVAGCGVGKQGTDTHNNGGRIAAGLKTLESGPLVISVATYTPDQQGTASTLGEIASGVIGYSTARTGAGGDTANPLSGMLSSITGNELEYGKGYDVGNLGSAKTNGGVIVRVPKAQAYLGALPAGWVDA